MSDERKPLRVRVVVEVEVDRDGYNAEYGDNETAADIRAHIKGEVGSAARSAFENIDSITVTDWE